MQNDSKEREREKKKRRKKTARSYVFILETLEARFEEARFQKFCEMQM